MTTVPRGIPRVLDQPLHERPDATAVEARAGSLTYRQLDAAADHAAGALWECGIRPGDRLAASLPNDLAVVVAFHAAMRIGAIWVGIGSALARPEKLHLLAHSTPTAMLAPAELAAELRSGTDANRVLPRLIVVAPGGEEDEWTAMVDAGLAAPGTSVDPHAPAGIAYTSGTTGTPKGVVHSQHNLLMPGAVIASERGYGDDLRKGDCLPMTILNLMALTTLLTAQAGGCCVVMDRRDSVGIAEWIRESAVNVWNGVPTQLRDLTLHEGVEKSDLATLREVWSGGGDCPDGLRRAFATKFGHDIRVTYGLTEVPTIVAIDPPGGEWHPGCSGQVLPHLAVQAVDDEGTAVPTGEVGELSVTAATTGPWAGQWTPMLGHWEDGEVLPASEPLVTGDLASLDDTWVRVVDRRKLLIVRGGANVYPAEVERVLAGAPGVAAAAVFGLPDDRLGERVAALVEPRQNEAGTTPVISAEELSGHCETNLARYKIPEVWGVVDALPRNAMGKIVRQDLRELLATATKPGSDT